MNEATAARPRARERAAIELHFGHWHATTYIIHDGAGPFYQKCGGSALRRETGDAAFNRHMGSRFTCYPVIMDALTRVSVFCARWFQFERERPSGRCGGVR